MRVRVVLLSALAVLALGVMWGCAPQVVEKIVTVTVEKPVIQTVEKPVPQTVVSTVEVEKTVVATVEVVKEVQKERPKLTVWFADDMAQQGTEWQEKMAYQFGVENNVDVEVYHDALEVYLKKLAAAAETGTLPDVWRSSEEFLPGDLKAGRLADVSDVVAELNKLGGGLNPGAIESVTFDGKQWGVPYWYWADAWYTRKDILEKKGLKPPTTFEEAAKTAIAVSDPKVPIYGWGLTLGPLTSDSNAELLTLLWSYGASVWSKDGKTVTLKSPETTKALELIRDTWKAGGMVPDAPNWDDYSNNLCYLNGTCAMIQNSGSVYTAMKSSDPKLLENTTIIASPAGPAGKASFTNWSQWDMNAKSQNPELAKKFLAWNMSPENQGDYMRMWGGQVFPLYNDLAKDPMWEDPYLKGFMENSLVTHTAGWPGPNTLWAQEAMKQHVLPAMVNRIVVENWPIEKAVDEAVQKLEDIYKALQ